MKTVPVDLKTLNDVVSQEAIKITKCNKLSRKANNLEKNPAYCNSYKSIQRQ